MDRDQNQTERRPLLLFAFANDERPGRRLAGLCREIEEIRRTLAPAEREGSCEIVVRESTTPAELVEVLEEPRYRRRLTTIHFAGHASGTRLLLEGEEQPIAARIQGLAPLLGELESLALVFLNGCGTLAQGERLIRTGIPAVIATESAVEDEQAQRFAVDFYRNVAGGASISEAFGRALAQAQCFSPITGVVRDLALAREDEEPTVAWRLLLADPHGDGKDWSLSTAIDDPLFGLPDPVGGVLPQEPFMGLRRFTARESAVLFGRGRAIRNLYGDVTDPKLPPLVVVCGPSGVGKSSLLEAGLLPRVAVTHEVHDLRLERGQDPEGLLREALAGNGTGGDLAVLWREHERARERPVVICLDQLEVLMLEDGGARALARFVRALVPLAGADRPRGKLLLGLRKEWFPELRNELNRHAIEWHDHFVEPLGRDDIEEVVLGPTRTASLRARYGITCEDGLASRIAEDLSRDRESAIAPMLQILLTRMWERTEPLLTSMDGRARRRFTLATYDELRRDGLALSDFVDRQLEALRATHAEALASGLVLELLFKHTAPRGTAASSTYAELRESYAHQWPAVARLIERCVSLYLLQTVADARGVETGVRLAHDTLAPIVRERYRRSKAPAQAAARLLEARMGMSEASGRSRLLDEHDLQQVETAQTGMRRWTDEEASLVDESRRQRTWASWLRRFRLAVVILSITVAIVAVVLAIRRFEPVNDAEVTSLKATVAAPEPARASHGEESMTGEVVTDSYEASPFESSQSATALESPAPADAPDHSGPRRSVAFEASEQSCDLKRLPMIRGSSTPIETMTATHEGELLAVGMGERNQAFVIESAGKTITAEIPTAKAVNQLRWSPDGRLLAIGEEGGHVELVHWDGSSLPDPMACGGHEGSISALSFSTDGALLMTADRKGQVIVRDARTCDHEHEVSLKKAIYDIEAYPGTSKWLLAGASGLVGWDASSTSTSPFPREGSLKSVTFSSRNGQVIAAGRRLQIWSRTGESLVDKSLTHVADWVFVDDRGETVITASSHGVGLWPLPLSTEEIKPLDTWEHEAITGVAVYPDLRDVLVVSADGKVWWLPREDDAFLEPRSLEIDATDGGAIVLSPSLRYFAVGDGAGFVSLVTLPTSRDQARSCKLNVVP